MASPEITPWALPEASMSLTWPGKKDHDPSGVPSEFCYMEPHPQAIAAAAAEPRVVERVLLPQTSDLVLAAKEYRDAVQRHAKLSAEASALRTSAAEAEKACDAAWIEAREAERRLIEVAGKP